MAGISHEFVDYLAGCWLIWNESGCDIWDVLVLYDTFFVYDVFIFSTGLAWTMFFFFFFLVMAEAQESRKKHTQPLEM